MKKHFTVGVSAIALSVAMAGCAPDEAPPAAPDDGKIVLNVEGLPREKVVVGTRAPIESLNGTDVSIFYSYDYPPLGGAPDWEEPLVVTVNNSNVDTGLYYPADNAATVTFFGLYPSPAPSQYGVGEAYYDLSNGDVDVMYTDWATGSRSMPVPSLSFKHLLGRITFRLQCDEGRTHFPERIVGVRARCSAPNFTPTGLRINMRRSGSLDSSYEHVTYGDHVFSGDRSRPIEIPAYGDPHEIDMMLRSFRSLELECEGESGRLYPVTIVDEGPVDNGKSLWRKITTGPSDLETMGKHFIVDLNFSGYTKITVGGFSVVTDWEDGEERLGGGQAWYQ